MSLTKVSYSMIDGTSVNVKDFGAVGDGTTSDTAAFQSAINYAASVGAAVFVPTTNNSYLITSTLTITERVDILGDGNSYQNQYAGEQNGGSKIKFTGSGPCFYVQATNTGTIPATQRTAFGQQFKDLCIEATASASHGIKVGDSANIGTEALALAQVTIENVFIYDVKSGRALGLYWCFQNNIKNFTAENCGVVATLHYAHATTFLGGSIQQSLVGLDVIDSFDVSLHGTTIQGLYAGRAAQFGLSVPSDFAIWTGGWNGTGTFGISRTVPADYAGVAIRNIGGIVSVHGGYMEAFNYGCATELDSHTHFYGTYVDFNGTYPLAWAQFGIGSFSAHNCTFQATPPVGFQGIFVTERFYANPISVVAPFIASTIPSNKVYVGPQTHIGIADQYDASSFKMTRRSYNQDYEFRGGDVTILSDSFLQTVWSYPGTYTGTTSQDLSVDNPGDAVALQLNGATITLSFGDATRLKNGLRLRVILSCTGSNSTIQFDPARFRTTAGTGTLTLNAGRLRVFNFSYWNNFFWQEDVEVVI